MRKIVETTVLTCRRTNIYIPGYYAFKKKFLVRHNSWFLQERTLTKLQQPGFRLPICLLANVLPAPRILLKVNGHAKLQSLRARSLRWLTEVLKC